MPAIVWAFARKCAILGWIATVGFKERFCSETKVISTLKLFVS